MTVRQTFHPPEWHEHGGPYARQRVRSFYQITLADYFIYATAADGKIPDFH